VRAAATEVRYAAFWPRLANYVIDVLITEVPLSILRVPLASTPVGAPLVAGIIIAAVVAVYETWTIAASGQTVGMRVMKLRVVREEGGGLLPLGRAAARSVPFWIFHLFFFLLPIFIVVRLLADIAFLWSAWDPRGQGLHDKLGRALVIRE
jgi:uncharacterized RDD family membrane protein YckC